MSNQLGQLIHDERKRRKLSYRVFANEIGVSTTYLVQIEAGKAEPSAKVLESTARVFEMDLNALLLAANRWDDAIADKARFNPLYAEMCQLSFALDEDDLNQLVTSLREKVKEPPSD